MSARTILVFLMLLLFAGVQQSFGAERFNGQCRVDAGTASNGCTVTVYDQGTVNLSSIFVDSGLGTPKANPFTADANGQFFFYAADARYDVVLTGGTPSVGTFTISDTSLGSASISTPGTVTSVALTMPSILSVAGSPITTSGTLAVTLATQADNLVFAGPSSGGPLAPTFRALVDSDIPNLSTLTSGLTGSRCVETDAGGLLTVAAAACGAGTVTSVALSAPSIFSVAGSPVTTTGTLALSLASQSPNTVFIAPDGASGAPTFRSLLAADIPNLDTAKITTGTFADARISQSSVTQHEAALTLGNLLGTLGATKGGTGLTTYTLGDIIYSSAANTLAKLAGNTTATKKFLTQTGTGSVSAAPAWATLAAADFVPLTSLTWSDGSQATLTYTHNINTGVDPVWTVTAGSVDLTAGTLKQGGTAVVLQSLTLTGGVGISAIGDLSANRTITFDATELGTLVWGDSTLASKTWTHALSGATDPVWTIANDSMDLTTGVLKMAGSRVITQADVGTGLSLATNTLNFDATELGTLTWSNGSLASLTRTFSLSGATDPVWTIGDNSMDLTTGVLKQGGNAVLTTISTHALLSATHSDTTAGTVVRGDLVTGQTATPVWQRLALGAAGTSASSDGTDIVWAQPSSRVHSGCTGTATSSTTLFQALWPASTCTDTTEGPNNQFLAMAAGTLRNLRVSSSAAGFNASSGVVTLRINAVNTAVTCTVGTGTTCSDTSNTAAVVAGDKITVQYTTQATETLADLLISFQY